MSKKRPQQLMLLGSEFVNYWLALTVTDLLFFDQAKGFEPESTGLSFP